MSRDGRPVAGVDRWIGRAGVAFGAIVMTCASVAAAQLAFTPGLHSARGVGILVSAAAAWLLYFAAAKGLIRVMSRGTEAQSVSAEG